MSGDKFSLWVENVTDEAQKKELFLMTEEEISSAFFKNLEFGTAGMRGIIGMGTNRINIYTVRAITEGICLFMEQNGKKSCAISYDSRIKSDVFAQTAAEVFAAHGIKVWLTKELMPTPFLSFAVRAKGADMGVMITASHNPKEYNGYKVYDGSGCQIIDDDAKEIADYIAQTDCFAVKSCNFQDCLLSGIVSYIDDEIEKEYMRQVRRQSVGDAKGLKVCYTPLCGTGYRLIPAVLESAGAEVTLVPSQSLPSGEFSTCPYPNPEKEEAMAEAIAQAQKTGAELIIASDPDADRMGLAVKTGEKYSLLTGNQTGILLTDFLLSMKKAKNALPNNRIIVRTVVTTDLVDKIAEEYGCCIKEVLTGFKYIGNVINHLESQGAENDFIIGFEESYGYLIGTHVRDKDAVVSSLVAAEMAAYYKAKGMTLIDRLSQIYERFGRYTHKQFSYRFEGETGERRLKEILTELRRHPLTELCAKKVEKYCDYSAGSIDFPKANMLDYSFEGGRMIIRPSGTEPLVKVYVTAKLDSSKNEAILDSLKKLTDKIFGG